MEIRQLIIYKEISNDSALKIFEAVFMKPEESGEWAGVSRKTFRKLSTSLFVRNRFFSSLVFFLFSPFSSSLVYYYMQAICNLSILSLQFFQHCSDALLQFAHPILFTFYWTITCSRTFNTSARFSNLFPIKRNQFLLIVSFLAWEHAEHARLVSWCEWE